MATTPRAEPCRSAPPHGLPISKTGRTAVVTIRGRGPYVAGRIVDLSPATARQIGLDRRTGVTRVAVSPITVPMPNGKIKLGDGVLQADL